MTKELEKIIAEFNKKLDEAQDARHEVEKYLEDEYGINLYENAGYLEDECNWCYGFNFEHIENLIERYEKCIS